MRHRPSLNRRLELVLVEALRLFALQLAHQLNQIVVFGDADDQAAAPAVDQPHTGEHFLDAAHHLLLALALLQVHSQSVALPVVLFQVKRRAHALHPPLHHHANSIGKHVRLLHRVRGQDDRLAHFQLLN